MRVGLTGGIATGKSVVADQLENLGAFVVRADQIGKQVMQPSGEAYELVIDAFGADILQANGEIDRARLASLVFAHPEQLRLLESIVQPAIFEVQDRLFGDYFAQTPQGIGVIEAAVLIEAGRASLCQRIILCYCPEALEIERAVARGRISEAEVKRRIAQQMPLDEKRKFADYVIDTSTTMQETLRQTQLVWQRLVWERPSI
jgi:dephospho-CoA kinase